MKALKISALLACGVVWAAQGALVGEWTFDEDVGSFAVDSSGNGFHGTIVNATSVESGRRNEALLFNGTGAYVEIPVAAFATISNQLSIALWAYGEPDSGDMNAFYGMSGSTRELNAHIPAGTKVYWDAGTDAGARERISATPDASVLRGTWTHWVFTKNATTGDMTIYTNGAVFHSESGFTAPIDTLTSFRIGREVSSSNYFYDGMLDEFQLYDTELSSTDVAALYESDWTSDEDSGTGSLPFNAELVGTNVVLRWESEAGAQYDVLRANNLALDIWSVDGAAIDATPPMNTYTTAVDNTVEFFEVKLAADASRNPFITHIFTADPSAHVWADGKMWVYPSHDQDDATSYDSMDGHHVYSSPDLVTWTDHGEIMHTDDISWARSGHLWAPDCAYKDGTYYYYYPARDQNNDNRIGMATSSSPSGPFTDSGSYIEGTDEIDPCCFIDDDGQAYLYWGGHTVRFAQLNDDMKTLGEITEVELTDFYEGAWMHKRNGIYYLSYATGVKKPIAYCTSTSPTGPFTYRGILMDAEVTGGATNHHSIVWFNGRWYIFYHNIALSGVSNRRSICVDYLYYNEDGTIQKVVQTNEGVAPVSYNLAMNKTATQSSTANGAAAERAVDGNTSSEAVDASATATESELNAWWQVDLGANFIITGVSIWNQTDLGAAADQSDYTITVFDSLQSEVWSSHQTSPAERPTTVSVGGAIGQYVKVQLAGEDALSLAEVEVMGHSIPVIFEPTIDPVNVALNKDATASSSYGGDYTAEKAFDGDLVSRWAAKDELTPWIEVDMGSEVSVNGVKIIEGRGRIQSYEIQVYNNESWDTAFVGGNPSSLLAESFPPVTGSRFRLQVTAASDEPTIEEIELYAPIEP